MKYKILVVDDEPGNLRLLERLFRRSYTVISASSGAEALKLLELHDAALIVSDQRMPGMTGIEFLKRAAELRPQTVRIILTGYTDVNDLVEAINSRVVYKYVTKPWVNEDLLQTVTRGLEHYESFKERHDLIQQNARLSEQVTATKKALCEVVSKALAARDPSWPDRRERMSQVAQALGRWLELSDDDIGGLVQAVDFCESDKLSVNGNQESALDAGTDPWSDLLYEVPGMGDVAVALRFKNERFDGTGFPDQLVGDRIPLFARILSIVTAYDQMMPREPGEDPSHKMRALEALGGDSGRFDPALAQAFRAAQSMDSAATTQSPRSAETEQNLSEARR